MAAQITIDHDALLESVACKLAEAILARPGFADMVVARTGEEVARATSERVGAMIDKLLVERASETFAACDHAVELVRMETMRSARQRVAESLPTKDDVRRESLAVIRDAVMRAFAPAVEKVAEYAGGVAVAFSPNPVAFPPEPLPTPAWPQPPAVCSGRTNGCKCFNCDPPF